MNSHWYETAFKLCQGGYHRLCQAKPENRFGYAMLTGCREFVVYKRLPGARKVETAYGNVVVLLKKGKQIYIYPDYRYPAIHFKAAFHAGNFPGLIENSHIAYCRILPYFRKVTKERMVRAWRLIVVTDHGQIYHNFPAQHADYDGSVYETDMMRFEESVVWDLPGRKYPSYQKNHASYERYYPGLPEEAYQYHPAVNKNGFYQNGGFPASKDTPQGTLCRFYISRRVPDGNPFFYMSGFCADYKMALIGTYRGNISTGVRTCIFASDDGGRQWYCKYEFGDTGEYSFQQGTKEWGHNFGNPIRADMSTVTGGRIELSKRICVIPNAENKEPKDKFSFGEKIGFLIKGKEKELTLTSQLPHELSTGNIVAVLSAPPQLNWMVNDIAGADIAGNELFFKIEKLDDYTVRLYEFVASPNNPISCRHIHHINRVRDGWLIGTGEIYPNSWLLYMQMKEADTFANRSAADAFDIFRLNSTENSVQRTLGTIWYDDPENTLLFASDHDVLPGKSILKPIEGREIQFSRNATGIYKGRLKDIDDYNLFQPVFEATEPAYLLQKLDRAIVFSGQRGEIALSFDGGNTWTDAHIDGSLNHPRGGTYQFYIFDDYLLEIK